MDQAIKLASTEDLLDELTSRSRAFAIAYEMPENGDDQCISFRFGFEDFDSSIGIFQRLKSRVEMYLAHEAMDDEYTDEEEEEDDEGEEWQTA